MDVVGISVKRDGPWGKSWILRVENRPIVMNDEQSFTIARELFVASAKQPEAKP